VYNADQICVLDGAGTRSVPGTRPAVSSDAPLFGEGGRL
jgi:hypothetical protein